MAALWGVSGTVWIASLTAVVAYLHVGANYPELLGRGPVVQSGTSTQISMQGSSAYLQVWIIHTSLYIFVTFSG